MRYEEQLGSEVSSGLIGPVGQCPLHEAMPLGRSNGLWSTQSLSSISAGGPPGSYQESAGTFTSTHTHERDSPKMSTVLVEGRVEKRSGEKRGEEKKRATVRFAFGSLGDYMYPAE